VLTTVPEPNQLADVSLSLEVKAVKPHSHHKYSSSADIKELPRSQDTPK